MANLVTKDITKCFDGKTIIEEINIELNDKELVSLIGVSGAGKTTLFNTISGLISPEQGQQPFHQTPAGARGAGAGRDV